MTALLACAAGASAAAEECLASWRVAGAPGGLGNLSLTCRDGDPACDRDGAADGTCRVVAAVCLNAAGCAASTLDRLEIGGSVGAAVAAQAAALGFPATAEVCTAPAEVAVALDGARRRRATLRARASGTRRDDDRLRIRCVRAGGGRPAVVVTTDFETGVLRTVATQAPRRVGAPDVPIHSDAVVRVSAGMVFVLNRFLADNVQRLDAERGLRTRFQCSTGPASNPHDIVVVAPDKAYVTRYDRAELWVVDPSVRDCARFRRGVVDLSAFADGDGLPEMSQIALVDGALFVTVQRLDRRRGFASTGTSRMVVVDTATDAVSGEIVLHGGNPFGDSSGIVHEPGTGKLVIASAGDIFEVGDGGLERIDPVTRTAAGSFFVDETTLGGNVLDFVLSSPTKGYAVVQDAGLANKLVAFDPSAASPPRTLYAREAFFPDVTLGPDGLLWLADQGLPDPGIRLFDPATDRPAQARPVRVGLPPFSIGFLP
jgi:hypothetical protein